MVIFEFEVEFVVNVVCELVRCMCFFVVFGGFIEEGVVSVISIVGVCICFLDGLWVCFECGFGGCVMIEFCLWMISDYGLFQQIMYDYDVFVFGEGLCILFVLLIVVQG